MGTVHCPQLLDYFYSIIASKWPNFLWDSIVWTCLNMLPSSCREGWIFQICKSFSLGFLRRRNDICFWTLPRACWWKTGLYQGVATTEEFKDSLAFHGRAKLTIPISVQERKQDQSTNSSKHFFLKKALITDWLTPAMANSALMCVYMIKIRPIYIYILKK